VTEPSFTAAEPLTDEENTSMNIALFIVVPIFLACYCGSCLAYIIYKIYSNCCGRLAKSQIVNLDGIENPARGPPGLPSYTHAPGQPRPPLVKPDTLPDEPTKSPPPCYESQAGAGVPDTGKKESPADESGGVPIAEIIMKKMASKSFATSY